MEPLEFAGTTDELVATSTFVSLSGGTQHLLMKNGISKIPFGAGDTQGINIRTFRVCIILIRPRFHLPS